MEQTTIVFLILWATDILLTFYTMSVIKKKFPLLDFKKYEYNNIIAWCWKKWGLGKGTVMGMVVLSPLITALAYVVTIDSRFYFIMVGAYGIVISIHLRNLSDLFTKPEEMQMAKLNAYIEKDTENKPILAAK